MTRVAVIGGGIAGLTCARELQAAGVATVLYEQHDHLGGRMSTRFPSDGGLAFDVGANFLVAAYTSVCAQARSLGLSLRMMSPVSHQVFHQGQLCRMKFSTLAHVFRLEALSPWSRLKFLALVAKMAALGPELDFFDLCTVPPELNREDAYSYALREVGRDFADYFVDPFNSCMMFSRASEITAAAFLALVGMLAQGRFDSSILCVEGEMQALADALARGLDVRRGVQALEPREAGWQVDGEPYSEVVLATPAGEAHRLLERGPAPQRGLTAATRYASTLNVSFRVPVGSLGRTHCFYVPFVENPLISEFTNEALKGSDTTRDGWSLVNVGLHEAGALPLLDASEGVIFERVGAALRSLVPQLEPRPYALQRWPEAIPKYDCAHVERVRNFLAHDQGEGGLYLCGDYLNAPWIEGACRSGRAAALALLSRRPAVTCIVEGL